MSKGKKIALGIAIVIVLILGATVIVVPLLLDIDRYRPEAAARIEQETGKPVKIGHMALTLLPQVSIRIDDFSMGNPPSFPQGDFVKARRIYAVVDARALWNRQVLIRSLELDDPSLNLLSDARGRWNFENPSPTKRVTDSPRGKEPLFTLGEISKLSISKGHFLMANVLSGDRIGPAFLEIRGVSSQLRQVNLNAFVESASSRFELPSTGTYASAGRSWFSSLVYAASTKTLPVAQGTLNADSLRFGAISVEDLKSRVRLFPKQVYFDDVDLTCSGGHATGDLMLSFAGQNLRYNTNVKLQGVNVAQFLNSFPDGRGKMTGTLDGTTKLTGEVTHSPDPLAGIRGSGQVNVRKGELPSLQLNKNLLTLARVANIGSASGSPSAFSSISTDFSIADQRITTNKISIIGNGVDIDGSGSMTLVGEGSLDYQGVAKIAAEQNAISNVLMGLTGATFSDGKLALPFRLGGTINTPRFTLTSVGSRNQLQAIQGAIAGSQAQGGQAQQPADAVQSLVDMFKKKKKQ
jgi:uncharacterized protein involved in outer membrane biogenesis